MALGVAMTHRKTSDVLGFEHWILGTADLAKPLPMPIHLPYRFSPSDEYGRVPFADVSLASRYKWAMDPANGHPLHDSRGTRHESLNPRAAVARCMLYTYMYAFYASQRFIEATEDNPNKGTVNTAEWREATSGFLLQQSGIEVIWVTETPKIEATRDPDNSLPDYWDMVGVNYFDDGRARPVEI